MTRRDVLALGLLVVGLVFALSFVYEFALEDLVATWLYGAERYVESRGERWEYVITATVFAALALVLPLRKALRLAVERERFAAELSDLNRRLEARVVERTDALERELAERRRAEQALRLGEERFRDFAETAADWFWEMDADLRFTSLSGRYRDLAGVTPEQVLGLAADAHLDACRGDPQSWAHLLRDLEAWKPYRETEFVWNRPTGGTRLLRSSGKAVLGADGRLLGYRGTAWDVTAQRQAERELRDARRLAEAASTFKSRFLAHMSHEVRTPLNSVLGLLELLERSGVEAEQRRLVRSARSSGQLLLSLINDVLDISRIEAGKLRLEAVDFELHAVIDGVLELFELEAKGRGLALSAEIEPQVPRWLRGDPRRINQVLNNLVGNAIKFTERGSVHVHARVEELRDAQVLVRFDVRDTGVGIEPEMCAEVFESFVQASDGRGRERLGSGLGLAIAKQLTELMGGSIGCESTPGAGSTFSFSVCLAPASGEAPVAPDAPAGDGGASLAGRVLLAEDNPVNAWVATSMLKGLGCEVEAVANGGQVLEALAADRYDLILMDCEMPGMDGFAATRSIRARERAAGAGDPLPIVALTAHALDGFRERCFAAGMDDYLAKPFSEADLGRVLARWLPGAEAAHRRSGEEG